MRHRHLHATFGRSGAETAFMSVHENAARQLRPAPLTEPRTGPEPAARTGTWRPRTGDTAGGCGEVRAVSDGSQREGQGNATWRAGCRWTCRAVNSLRVAPAAADVGDVDREYGLRPCSCDKGTLTACFVPCKPRSCCRVYLRCPAWPAGTAKRTCRLPGAPAAVLRLRVAVVGDQEETLAHHRKDECVNVGGWLEVPRWTGCGGQERDSSKVLTNDGARAPDRASAVTRHGHGA